MRIAKQEDWLEIDKYCKKYDLATPGSESVVFLSHDETGNINGLVGSSLRMTIEPMIADNPTVARRLWDMVIGSTSIAAKEVYVTPKSEELIHEAEKLGFKTIDEKVNIMVRSL